MKAKHKLGTKLFYAFRPSCLVGGRRRERNVQALQNVTGQRVHQASKGQLHVCSLLLLSLFPNPALPLAEDAERSSEACPLPWLFAEVGGAWAAAACRTRSSSIVRIAGATCSGHPVVKSKPRWNNSKAPGARVLWGIKKGGTFKII